MNELHVNDLLPAYVLGGLAEEEQRQVELHLRDCPICQADLRAYEQTAGAMAESVPMVQPPARLRAAVLERVAPPQRRSILAGLGGWLGGPRLAPALALISLLLVVGLTAMNLQLREQLRQADTANFRTIVLYGTDAAPQASGLMVTGEDGESGTLIVDHLPPLPESQQYQLWLVIDEEQTQREDGGVFSVDEEGYSSLWIWPEKPLESYPAFGVTIEPAGGSPGPTGPRVLGSQL